MSLSFADIVNAVKVMMSGLKSNSERMESRGINPSFTEKFETSYKRALVLDNEQEDLKAKLKKKTAELDKELEGLKKMLSEATKAVKLEMEKESWKSFGINTSK